MGEYANYHGEQVKIGTCESMYYLRADQAHEVEALSGNVDPVTDGKAGLIRFRFPFPDEDGYAPGAFEDYDRGIVLRGMEAPPELADDHYSVQFKADNGYLCSLPCPESGKVPVGLKVHRNGYGGAVELVQQRYIDTGELVGVCRCKGCGVAWRLQTVEDAGPALDALEAMAAEQDRIVQRDPECTGNAAVAAEYREIARRLVAGYAIEHVHVGAEA